MVLRQNLNGICYTGTAPTEIKDVWMASDRDITNRVIHAREEAGMSKTELAERLGLSASGYSLYENYKGTFTVEQLFQLSRILGHSTLDMVRQYVALAEADAASAHRRASPADNWRLNG